MPTCCTSHKCMVKQAAFLAISTISARVIVPSKRGNPISLPQPKALIDFYNPIALWKPAMIWAPAEAIRRAATLSTSVKKLNPWWFWNQGFPKRVTKTNIFGLLTIPKSTMLIKRSLRPTVCFRDRYSLRDREAKIKVRCLSSPSRYQEDSTE